LAWLEGALVDVGFTVFSFESFWAFAGVIVDSIVAMSAILTWHRLALIDVMFAIRSVESR
jgi:hypothetical protein